MVPINYCDTMILPCQKVNTVSIQGRPRLFRHLRLQTFPDLSLELHCPIGYPESDYVYCFACRSAHLPVPDCPPPPPPPRAFSHLVEDFLDESRASDGEHYVRVDRWFDGGCRDREILVTLAVVSPGDQLVVLASRSVVRRLQVFHIGHWLQHDRSL